MAGPGSHGGEGTDGCPLCRPGRGSGEHTGGGASQPGRRNGLGPPGRWVGALHALSQLPYP